MKNLILSIFLILFFCCNAIIAVRIVDPANSTMYVDEGFECPYVLELSNQEGTTLTATEMAAITKIWAYFGTTEYVDTDSCAACFDSSTDASKGRIIVDFGSYDWTDGTDTATLIPYSADYPSGRRIGTFSMSADQTLSAVNNTFADL